MADPALSLSNGAQPLSGPANQQQSVTSSPIAGTVLPIRRAEELLATLPGVIAARIVASESGAVDEIHVLTTSEVTAKQTVRNVESALIAHLGMRVDHRKISVATTIEPPKSRESQESSADDAAAHAPAAAPAAKAATKTAPASRAPAGKGAAASPSPRVETVRTQEPAREPAREGRPMASRSKAEAAGTTPGETSEADRPSVGRQLLYESVEVQRSRAAGVTYRVTLRKGAESFIGESGGFEDDQRTRVEHVARAALEAIKGVEGDDRQLQMEGCKVVEAFERRFAFVGVTAREGRDAALLTGSCEIKESAETSAVLAVLDATNRWIERTE